MKIKPSSTGEATYCPEDNKLRLYVGRVPREEYNKLRAEGWTSTPKQDCDFVAVWTPDREDTALAYAGEIGDEDQDPGERAADRAERFAGYQGKRLAEATGHADSYEDGPAVHGYQDPRRAEKAAARHDRQADKAVTQWSKAEYWQRRTAGVISNALYKDLPGVRMGRIKGVESELRKIEAAHKKAHDEHALKHRVLLSIVEHSEGKREKMTAFPGWQWSIDSIRESDGVAEDSDLSPEQMRRAMVRAVFSGNYEGQWYELSKQVTAGEIPAAEACKQWLNAYGWGTPPPFDPTKNRWHQHLTLRLAYENQMLEGQGGRLEQHDIEPGGKIGGKLILKASKSSATGRVTSVAIIGPKVEGWTYKAQNLPGTQWAEYKLDTERLDPSAYTPPTEESLAELANIKAEIKSALKKAKGETIPLVNPTNEDAERLQAVWNSKRKPSYGEPESLEVIRMTQAEYSAQSKGTYARFESKEITGGGFVLRAGSVMRRPDCPVVAKVRGYCGQVVVITDKPQKPFPAAVWLDPRPAMIAEVRANFGTLQAFLGSAWLPQEESEASELFAKARIVGLAYADSMSQFGLTEAGHAMAKAISREQELATA